MLDLNVIYTIIITVTLFVSLLCPIITTLLNNHHQMKIKKMELFQSTVRADALHEIAILEDYLSSVTRMAISECADDMVAYGKTYGLALLYAPVDVQEKMFRINALVLNEEFEEVVAIIEVLIPPLQTILSKLQTPPQ